MTTYIDEARKALNKIMVGAPTHEDFRVGGTYDYDTDCGNSGDIADKAAAEEHLTHAQHAQRALAALTAHEAEVKELVQAAEAMDAHYSGSLDHQPPYVRAIRDALRPFTGDEK